MAVKKFRTFEEARRDLWVDPNDPRIFQRMRQLGAMASTRRPVRRGVIRLRSLEEGKRDKGTAWQVRPDVGT